MKKLILLCCSGLALVSRARRPAGGGIAWDKFPKERVTDMAALQNGAKLFVNYCLNCHNAAFMRYNRLRDIGLTEEQIKKNLMFATDKVGDTMKVRSTQGRQGLVRRLPPDLTLIARSRAGAPRAAAPTTSTPTCAPTTATTPRPPAGTTWPSPTSACRTCCGNCRASSAPCSPTRRTRTTTTKTVHVFKGFEPITKGTLSQAEYNLAVADLVAYLQWMGEPAQGHRVRLGVWVLLFLRASRSSPGG
jgi:ubiquinol-cytochrome c reductase cytochrome c1 subunit